MPTPTIGNTYIETYTGKKFSLDTPEFDIEDIAHSLGMLCRYNGHCRHFISVAEHSLIVSLLCEELSLADPMEGLLHDASEAYLSDVPSPFKQRLPEWQRIDDLLTSALREHFMLPEKKDAGVKEADWLSLFVEAYYLLSDRGECIDDPMGVRPRALKLVEEGFRPVNLQPRDATDRFMQRFEELLP